MKVDPIRVAGLTITVLATLFFLMLILENDFPAFKYINPAQPARLVENKPEIIGQEVGRFLWSYRMIDLIAQAFVLFAAAACCVALLTTKERKR